MNAAAELLVKQLKQLHKEIAHVTARSVRIQAAWLIEKNHQQRADLKMVWQQHVKEEEKLLGEWQLVYDLLTSSGVQTSLVALCTGRKVLCMSCAVRTPFCL